MSNMQVAGRTYAVIPYTDAYIRPVDYHGKPWTEFRVNNRDRLPWDPLDKDRCRLDGSPQPFVSGAAGRMKFTFKPIENIVATGPLDWLVFFELHSKVKAGDLDMAGPVKFSVEWSAGSKKSVGRITHNAPIFDSAGKLTGQAGTPLWTGEIVEGTQYIFDVQWKDSLTDGFFRVTLFNKTIVDYTGPFGYGPGRPLYPCYGPYRHTRKDAGRAMILIEDQTLNLARVG